MGREQLGSEQQSVCGMVDAEQVRPPWCWHWDQLQAAVSAFAHKSVQGSNHGLNELSVMQCIHASDSSTCVLQHIVS